MPKVIYKKVFGLTMVGVLDYSVLPTCPVCEKWTNNEDTCPSCRENGILTELEYDGTRTPGYFDENGDRLKAIVEYEEETDE